MYNPRKNRGLTQKLFLIETIQSNNNFEREFVIMGSTCNVYNVVIKNNPSCTCPDHKLNNRRCKHIYFVLIKIMCVTDVDKICFSNDDLSNMFSNMRCIPGSVQISEDLKQLYNNIKNKSHCIEKDLNDCCPICLDELENGEDILTCKYSCGRHIHSYCFELINKNKTDIRCIYCKQLWNTQTYVNLNK